jgi:3-hydroxybutyryl-CoA dehydrogenase
MRRDLVAKVNAGFISMTNITFENVLLNFGFGTKEEKKEVLRINADKNVYMDLTCFNPVDFYTEFPQLKGVFSALFCDEAKKMEIHFREKHPSVLSKMIELGFFPVECSFTSLGFVFPRTIVQIINEAHFALEEEVATKDDIDRAMKFGVNYPKGPFEWSAGREVYVKTLLNELLKSTGDTRYRASRLLDIP